MTRKLRLKICGMREPGNIREVAGLGPDYMGFIFYPESKRVVPAGFELPPDFPDGIERVGVFVNEKTDVMLTLARKHCLNFVQLHGDEPPGQCEELAGLGIKVIKAFSVDGPFDFASTIPYRKGSAYFLFDSKGPGYGGTGKMFDWSLLEKYDQETPFFLSGGLSLDRMDYLDQLNGMNLHAIDINSGAETAPGHKDVQMIKAIQARYIVN